MAALRISSAKPQKTYWAFTKALASAVLEWLLISLLFVNAIFSYLITKLAHYCELQTPCLLCSRLDHVFGNKKLGYYWDLICGNHKVEISSLVLCHAHDKLVDVHRMCENCLFSFATINKSNAETYRLLVGKLGEESKIGCSSSKHCSCCNEPWVSGGYAEKLIRSKSIGSEADELDVPLSGIIGPNQDDLKMRRGKPSVSDPHIRTSGLDPLSHVGYTELKVTSDTESEVLYSDDEDENVLLRKINNSKDDLAVRGVQLEPLIITLADDSATEKLIESKALLRETYVSKDDVQGVQLEPLIILADNSATEKLIISNALLHKTDDSKDDLAVQGAQLEPLITLTDNSATEKLIISDSAPEASSSASHVQLGSIEPHGIGSTSVESTVSVKNDLEELNWQQPDSKANSPALTELISLDDSPSSSNAVETTIEVSKGTIDLMRTGEVWQTSMEESGTIYDARTTLITPSENGLEAKPVSTDTAQQLPNLLDLGDAYKIAVSNKGRQLSGVLAERAGKDSTRVSADFRILLTQLSATRGLEQSMNDKSPRFSVNSDEPKTSDALNSIGMQIPQKRISMEQNESVMPVDGSTLQKRVSLERNESGLSLDGNALQNRISLERNESGLSLDGSALQKRISLERNESGLSLDGSIVSEMEGESMVDRLKRQVDHDRKHMSALYKELEEERNASAIAVNQSMAMITKLQEEKATLHMEALQCLRLMEEQSEYDMEALQKANDLLAKKEKEIQDLEAELEFYKNNFLSESILENVVEETHDIKARDIEMDQTESIGVEDSASGLRDSVSGKRITCDKVEGTGMPLGGKDTSTMKNADLQFEDEKLYILKCLKKLEKKLYLFSNDGIYLEYGEYSRSEGDGESEFKESNFNGGNKENGGVEENDFSMQHDVSVSCRDLHAQFSFEKAQLVYTENSEIDSSGLGSPVLHKGSDLASLGNEVLDLNGRLGALEADQTFLEHTFNSLRNGEEGLRLIREVASHLRELRRRIDSTVA